MATTISGSDNFNTNNVATQTELDASPKGLGDGQTWQTLSSSRTHNTTYTNTTGRTIHVTATWEGSTGNYIYLRGYIDGTQTYRNCSVSDSNSSYGKPTGIELIVPSGSTYMIARDTNGSPTQYSWRELR